MPHKSTLETSPLKIADAESGPAAAAVEAEAAPADATPGTPPPESPPVQPPPAVTRYASIYPGPSPGSDVSAEFAQSIRLLQEALGMPVWFLLHGETCTCPDCGLAQHGAYDYITEEVADGFVGSAPDLPKEPVALVLHSPGGDAKSAYLIADVLRRRCGGFVAVVPRYAKSAATLLSLGASRIIMAPFAELGPLDAQIPDPEREDVISALDEVHALDRLHAFSLEAIDRTLTFFKSRSGKKIDTLLPRSSQLVTDLVRPLFEKIDAVHYTQMSRVLKVAEDYAVRLLQPEYATRTAHRIARNLVENYPDHRFMIDQEEASRVGLRAELAPPKLAEILAGILLNWDGSPKIGTLTEEKPK